MPFLCPSRIRSFYFCLFHAKIWAILQKIWHRSVIFFWWRIKSVIVRGIGDRLFSIALHNFYYDTSKKDNKGLDLTKMAISI